MFLLIDKLPGTPVSFPLTTGFDIFNNSLYFSSETILRLSHGYDDLLVSPWFLPIWFGQQKHVQYLGPYDKLMYNNKYLYIPYDSTGIENSDCVGWMHNDECVRFIYIDIPMENVYLCSR